jgi:hypothetical protein
VIVLVSVLAGVEQGDCDRVILTDTDFVNGRVVGIPEYVLVKEVVLDLVIVTDLVIDGDTDLVFN